MKRVMEPLVSNGPIGGDDDAVPALSSQRKPTYVLEPRRDVFDLGVKAVWEYRELLYFLIWRDVKVRYKQTVIGVIWVILQPLLTTVVFTFVFGRLANIPSDGVPYPLLIFTALLPWNLFANAIGRGGISVVSSANLVSKIYFPRLVLPLSSVLAPLVDFVVGFGVLIGMTFWYRWIPGWPVLALPLFVLLTMLTALAIVLWLASLNVRYRDVGYAIPFIVQLWMFVSPVVYPVSEVNPEWRFVYGLNPMAGVIEGFRWALLGKDHPDFRVIAASSTMVAILLVPSLLYFRRTERTFADIV
jgi:lipopolysaccharide transport system permease protein